MVGGCGAQVVSRKSPIVFTLFTLVAFVRLFSRVDFQVCPQIASPNRCVLALVANVGLLSFIQRLLGMFCEISFHFHVFQLRTNKLCYARLTND